MKNMTFIKRKLPLFIILFLLLAGGGVFLIRTPVLVVVDTSFSLLYGPLRLRLKSYMTSLELFRRVIPVEVAESAGSDLIALAVQGASRSPRAAFFPFRYLEGARYYKNQNPEIPVFVMGGSDSSRAGTDLTFVSTDIAQDLYRAGLFAAYFAGNEKGILFFMDGDLSMEYRNAFRQGLKDQGFINDPYFLSVTTEYSAYSDIGCVVTAGPAAKYVERNLKIPLIVFSWVDPSLTPRSVKLVFDDSPIALAAKVLKSSEPAEEIYVSSEPVLLFDRLEEKKDFRMISRFSKEKFEKI